MAFWAYATVPREDGHVRSANNSDGLGLGFPFPNRRGCWIVAEMDDGSLVGGEYGAGSFVSLSPHRADLFLEKEYYLDEDHNFLDALPDTVGVWINAEKVKHIHLYRVSEDEG